MTVDAAFTDTVQNAATTRSRSVLPPRRLFSRACTTGCWHGSSKRRARLRKEQLPEFCCCCVRQRIAWHPERQVNGRDASPFWNAHLAAVYRLHAVKPLRLQQLRLHTP